MSRTRSPRGAGRAPPPTAQRSPRCEPVPTREDEGDCGGGARGARGDERGREGYREAGRESAGRAGSGRRDVRSRSASLRREALTLAPRRRSGRVERDHSEPRRGAARGHALFLMGLPGAGKTTVKRRRMHRGDLDIEPDCFKSRHPRYAKDMGEETDEEVHRWSVRRAVDAFDDATRDPRKPNLVFDSSGSNARWLLRRIAAAREAGYTTELLWVDVPLEIALFRNRDRARRGQWCPERVIMDKAKVMENSFEELRREVDSAERLQNWSERGGELTRAKWDLYVYPGPRTRPCGLRPGDEGYGESPAGARSPSPTPGSRRTIQIGPWKRNDEVAKKKNARLAWMDSTYSGNRERYVSEEVLGRRDALVEPNKFPYHLPPDIEHWTIWSRRDLDHRELCEYMEAWLDARKPHNVIAWNYDDNRGRRTIDIWHVHIYFKGAGGEPPRLPFSLGAQKSSSSTPGQRRSSSKCSPCSV